MSGALLARCFGLRAAQDAIGGGPPIPFGSGYRIRPDETNLLIAVKR